MDLRQLEAFVAASEEGGITRAADRLHVVQSAVSASLRRLEAELGAPLLERRARGVALTDAGRALLPHARAALAAAQTGREAVDAVRGGLGGTVRLGIMQSQGSRVSVPRLLRDFRDRHPGVELRVGHMGGSVEMAAQVAEGALDLAFVALTGRDAPPGVELAALAAEPLDLICPPDHRFAGRAVVEPGELGSEPLAETPPGWGTRILSDRLFAAAAVDRQIVFEVNDLPTLLDLVRNELALALLPGAFVLDDATLVAVPLRDAPDFQVALARPSGRRLGAAAEALAELVVSRSRAVRR